MTIHIRAYWPAAVISGSRCVAFLPLLRAFVPSDGLICMNILYTVMYTYIAHHGYMSVLTDWQTILV
jgi:hypothetical protein